MKRAAAIIAVLLISAAGGVRAEEYAADEVIVKFKRGAKKQAMAFQAAPMRTFGIGKQNARKRRFTEAVEDYAVIKLTPGTSVEEALSVLRARGDIESATP